MIYIQRKGDGCLETVDQFTTHREARAMLAEYRMADPSAHYYTSARACKAWRGMQGLEGRSMNYEEQERLAYIAGDTERASLLGLLADMELELDDAQDAESPEDVYVRGYIDGEKARGS